MATDLVSDSGAGRGRGDGAAADQRTGPHGLLEVLEKVEHDLILGALRESRGNKAKAARALGITERLMGIRVKRLGIDWRGLRKRRLPRTGEALRYTRAADMHIGTGEFVAPAEGITRPCHAPVGLSNRHFRSESSSNETFR